MNAMMESDIKPDLTNQNFEWVGKIPSITDPEQKSPDEISNRKKRATSFEAIPEDPRENLASEVFDASSFVSINDIEEAMKRKITSENNQIVNAETNDTYRVLDHFDSSDDDDATTLNNSRMPVSSRKISANEQPTPKLALGSVSRVRKMKSSPEISFGTEEGRKAFNGK
mmetsp:Transcript_11677/g.10151  ORF Transcript_11677/g.10151 Transcript_11677/m.10151 type:complete len:170 (+) Transcript_11677:301-810(+)|eukprot:CAMPEP_0114587422 /NCGR_PEP_ID=MMETSP0125-20121206/10383_1 /TAXON_ID=485358 ORGANISM="Aristerostoma sp., Strain ATCC 50986" /NCGR_SAMPLE_ID=MMETSP0125 /ASSEMBLY_ACC=CAM_ASM_000245 /LENGTH=169 /DNA_ID=CAMNT_0001783319 /DNA_START=791 /DNA_END=1300 /DNA_ORIENTATION=-